VHSRGEWDSMELGTEAESEMKLRMEVGGKEGVDEKRCVQL